MIGIITNYSMTQSSCVCR